MQEPEPFDAQGHMRKIRTRHGMVDYLDVKHRVLWLRAEHPDASIVTEAIYANDTEALFKATISYNAHMVVGRDGGIDYLEKTGECVVVATGHGSETAADFPGGHIEK